MSFQQKLLQDENRIRDALLDSKSSVFGENQQSPPPFGRDQWLGSILSLNGGNVDIEGFLNDLGTDAWKEITNFSEAAKSVIDEAYDWITTDGLGDTITQLTTFIGTISGTAAEWLATQGSVIKTAVIAGFDWLTDTASTTFANIWTKLKENVTFLNGLEDAITALQNAFGEAGQAAVDVINDLTEEATNLLEDPIGWIEDKGTEIGTALGEAWTNLETLLSTVGDNITTWANGLWSGASTFLTNASSWLQNRAGEIQMALGTTWQHITSFLSTIGNNITTWVNGLWNSASTFLTNAASWLSDRGSEIGEALGTAWENTTTFIGTISTTAAEWLVDRGTEIGEALGTAWENVSTYFTNIGTELQTFLDGPLAWIKGVFEDFGESLGLSDLGDSLSAVFSSIATQLTGPSSTTSASQNLDNLGSAVSINKSLTFKADVNTDPTDNTKAIGYTTNGDLKLKLPEGGNDLWVRINDTNVFRVHGKSIFLQSGGDSDPQINGEIKFDGSTVKVKTSSGVYDISDIGSGSGGGSGGGGSSTLSGGTALTQQQDEAGAFWIPVAVGGTNTSASDLDGLFGTEAGSIGILRPQTMSNTSASSVWLVWRTTPVSNISAWLGIRFESVVESAISNTGVRSGDLTYEKRTSPVHVTGSGNTPDEDDTGTTTQETGFWGTYNRVNNRNNGAFWLYEGTSLEPERDEHEFGNTTSSSVANTKLPAQLPTIQDTNDGNSSLEESFGVDDGYVGYAISGNRLLVKIGGYWIYKRIS